VQPKVVKAVHPWLRAGYSYGSGDGNASDNKHGTFFQLLPTPRPYARFPFFNLMNNEDGFAELILRPAAIVTVRSDIHTLRLTSANDLWYLGGGPFSPGPLALPAVPATGRAAWQRSTTPASTASWALMRLWVCITVTRREKP
jgi:hypothetical protein